MEIVGEASDGHEAMQYALTLQPDIILLDINMPVIDGVTVARHLHSAMPKIRVIFLTAYDTSENLMAAIDLKVSAFVLKSADSQNILKAVLKVKEELEQSNELQKQRIHLQNVYHENYHLIKTSLLTDFLNKKISSEHFLSKISQMHISLPRHHFSILLLRFNSDDRWRIFHGFSALFREKESSFFFLPEQMLFLIVPTPMKKETIEAMLPQMKPYISANSLSIISNVSDWESVPEIYKSLLSALDICFWDDSIEYYLVTAPLRTNQTFVNDTYRLEQEIISALIGQKSASIQEKWDSYKSYMQENHISQKEFLDSASRLATIICAVKNESDGETVQNGLRDAESPSDIFEQLESLMIDEKHVPHTQIELALDYITKHYAEELKLSDVANAVYISAGYLSRIFKQYTGHSFKEQLHITRIEEAKKLIVSTNLRYYQIAQMVGYQDYKYFSTYFSKYCGCSAKEYRYRQCQSEEKLKIAPLK